MQPQTSTHFIWLFLRIQEYTGGVPNQLQQLIKDVQREYCGSSSPLVLAAKAIAALSVLALGSFFAHKHLNKADSPNTSSDAAAELIELKRRIAAARSKLSAFDKAHRSKQARTQRKIVEQLEAKRRLMERGQSGQRGGDVAGRGKGAGKGHRREVEEDEFWPLPPPGPKCRRRQEEVMYSDEEGEVQQQWQRAIANWFLISHNIHHLAYVYWIYTVLIIILQGNLGLNLLTNIVISFLIRRSKVINV